jgi:4-hydroxybenzoate polyprenyltransferase
MGLRKPHGTVVSLLLCCHPLPAAAMTVALTAGAALTGRSGAQCLLVLVTVLSGQLTVGWINDVVDRDRDRLVGRSDKPIARGWIGPRTVVVATAGATVALVPLSLANGTAAGIAHLAAVLSAWTYDLVLKRTVLSWLPYAVSFGLLPAFLSYGGLGIGMHGAPPTVTITVLAALLGIGIHVLNVVPDLAEDERTGVRHLPLLIARRTGAAALLRTSAVFTVLVAAAILVAGFTVGLRQ